MQFVFPIFLTALAALAIPILIHLFHFRRFKTVLFTNVRFLRELKEESASRRRLRNLLVLLLRCLAVAALVFAFAQPFIPRATTVKKGEKAVSVFIDNSFSMAAMSKDLNLLDKAKQRAREIVNAYAADDRFQILTNNFEGKHQRLVSKEDALRLIDEVKATPPVQNLSTALTKQAQTLSTAKTPNRVAFLLSDFQKNISDIGLFKDSSIDVNLIPLTSVEQKNVAIDSAWFESPVQMVGQTNPLIVRVRNYANENVENVRLTLKLDGQLKPVSTLNIKANQTATDTIAITLTQGGFHEAELEITDYPIQFDDHYYFTFQVPMVLNALNIADGAANRFVDAALMSSRVFKLQNASTGNLDYSKLTNFQIIILNNVTNISSGLGAELKKYVENGGNLLIFPPSGGALDLTSYQNFLGSCNANGLGALENGQREVSTVNTNEFVFKDVFLNQIQNMKLPATTSNYRIQNRSGETLLSYRDGSSFLTKNKVGNGNIYLGAASLDEKVNNLVRNGEIFVPMIYKMAISSAKEWRIAYTLGKDDFIEADSKGIVGETAFKLKGRTEEFIPEQRIVAGKAILGVRESVNEAGFYSLYARPDSILAKYAFNFDRKESDLSFTTIADLKKQERNGLKVLDANTEANFTALVGEQDTGVVLWRWLVILALLALLAEILVLKFFKV
ncbi:MAG: hypothetical protein RL757_2672 [Bacteroidota bacterium]|jgi:hypothetical protein